MFDMTEENPPPKSRPFHTLPVIALWLIAALVFSYLGAYAVTDALVKADLISAWPPHQDPRRRWMLSAFSYFVGAFMLLACLIKWSSWKQIRTLEQSDED